MTFNKNELLHVLSKLTYSHIDYVKFLLQENSERIQYKVNEKSWSAIECIEHLNLYARFYNKEI